MFSRGKAQETSPSKISLKHEQLNLGHYEGLWAAQVESLVRQVNP